MGKHVTEYEKIEASLLLFKRHKRSAYRLLSFDCALLPGSHADSLYALTI